MAALVCADSSDLALLVTASAANFDLLTKRQEMLPFVVHGDHIQTSTLFIADAETGSVETIVGLNSKQPFLPFSAGHSIEQSEAFIVRPNIEYVDYLDQSLITRQSMMATRKMCSPVNDFETIGLHSDRVNSVLELNAATIRNRQCPDYIKCIDFLTSQSTTTVFKSLIRDAISPESMMQLNKDKLEASFRDAKKIVYSEPEMVIHPSLGVDEHWWTLEELRENQHEQAYAKVCVKQGHILEMSQGLIDLWGVPLDREHPITPADFAPETQLDGKPTPDKMLDVIRHALVKGHNRVNFTHTNKLKQTILCDLWIRRIGNFEDLNVIGHIKRAVAATPAQKQPR